MYVRMYIHSCRYIENVFIYVHKYVSVCVCVCVCVCVHECGYIYIHYACMCVCECVCTYYVQMRVLIRNTFSCAAYMLVSAYVYTYVIMYSACTL